MVKEGLFTFIRLNPVTFIFLLAYLIFTVLAVLIGGYDSETRLMLGAYDSEKVKEGEVWRLFTYSFGHMSFLHFLMNIPFILLLSRPLERLFGSMVFSATCIILSIFTGVIIHLSSGYPVPLAGSSGMGYGFLGIYIFLLFRQKHLFSAFDKKFIFYFVLFGILATFIIPDISKSGHFGGILGGLLLAPLLIKIRNKASKRKPLPFETRNI